MRLSAVAAAIDDLTYPLTSSDLVTIFGDLVIDLPGGTDTVTDVFTRLTGDTYESAEDARLMLYSGLSVAAIGREQYSDRDPPVRGAYEPDPVSF